MLRTAAITDGVPQIFQARVQRCIANELSRPELLKEFGFRNHAVVMHQEVGK
jgi:hypothetical protein